MLWICVLLGNVGDVYFFLLACHCRWVLAGHMVNSSHVFMKSRSTSDLVLTCIMGAEVFQIRDKPVSKIQQVSYFTRTFFGYNVPFRTSVY